MKSGWKKRDLPKKNSGSNVRERKLHRKERKRKR